MSVRAGHGHIIKSLKNVGGRCGVLHLQNHLEEGLRNCRMEAKFPPLMAALLVQMYSHHGQEPGEPGVNNLTGQVPLSNGPLLPRGETYA